MAAWANYVSASMKSSHTKTCKRGPALNSGHTMTERCPTLLYPTLTCPTLPYPTISYPTLPYLTLPYPTLPYLTYTTLPYPTLPYATLPSLTPPYLGILVVLLSCIDLLIEHTQVSLSSTGGARDVRYPSGVLPAHTDIPVATKTIRGRPDNINGCDWFQEKKKSAKNR